MRIGEYQRATLDKHIEKRAAGWHTIFRIGKHIPYTREFGTGWPISIITTHPTDPTLRIINELSRVRVRSNAYARIEAFKAYIKEAQDE